MIFAHKTSLLPALAGMTFVALAATALAGPPRDLAAPQYKLSLSQEPSAESHPLRMHFRPDGVHGPNLTLSDVSVEVVTLRSGLEAIRLRVAVRNVGNADWKSERHQQALMAYVGDEPFLVTTKLTKLRAGASRTFSVTLPKRWSPGLASAPAVAIALTTDEDIRLDGNPANDDADPSDNRIHFQGETVNLMVGR